MAHYYSDTATATSLISGIDNNDTVMTVASTSGFPSLFPYYLSIDRGTGSLEIVEVTDGTGGLLTVERGVSGTTGVAHNANAVVEHVAPALFFNSTSAALDILAGLGPDSGLFVQDSPGSFVKRTLTAANSKVVITNGSGAAGNPTVGVDEANFTGIPKAAVTGAPSGSFVGTTDTQTLTNKRVTPRAGSTASSATPSINTDDVDFYSITALAANITSMTSGLSGTPTDFQKLIIRFKDNGTARTIAWGASFASRGATLPTTTVASKVLTVGLLWNAAASVWDCVASSQEA